jgi:hypothetical protein
MEFLIIINRYTTGSAGGLLKFDKYWNKREVS